MDPIEPWIDASAVRRLAANLLSRSGEEPVDTGPDTGFGNDFVGFASDPPPVAETPVEPSRPPVPAAAAPPPPQLEEAPPKPFTPLEPAPAAPVQAPAPLSPPASPSPAEAAAPPAQEKRGPLLERLIRFRELLMRHTGAQGVFILDREGKPVMEDPAFGKLHFLARSLAQAYRPVAGQAGNVHVKIGSNAVLEVVPVETPFGCLVLGAVVPGPLTAAAVAEIATALRHAATPREA